MRCRVLLLVSVVVMAVVWGLSSCEKMIVDEESSSSTEQNEVKGNLILKISVAGVTPMETTRAEEADLSKFFTTLNLVVFKNGERVKNMVTQKVSDKNFGTLGMQLEPGTYQVIVVAHSSDGNPDVSLSQVKFANADGFSDTFYSINEIEVKEETKQHFIELTRVTSLLRFIINDEIPAEVNSIEFRLTGGSGAFEVTTGYGCVRSTQDSKFIIDHTQKAPHIFDLYTILWKEMKNDGLSLYVAARKADGKSLIKELDIKGIKVVRNAITEVSGNFFTDSPGGDDTGGGDNTGGDDTGGGTTEPEDSISTAFKVTVLTEWADTLRMKY